MTSRDRAKTLEGEGERERERVEKRRKESVKKPSANAPSLSLFSPFSEALTWGCSPGRAP